MSDEENSGVFSRRNDYERRVPVATLPLPAKECHKLKSKQFWGNQKSNQTKVDIARWQ